MSLQKTENDQDDQNINKFEHWSSIISFWFNNIINECEEIQKMINILLETYPKKDSLLAVQHVVSEANVSQLIMNIQMLGVMFAEYEKKLLGQIIAKGSPVHIVNLAGITVNGIATLCNSPSDTEADWYKLAQDVKTTIQKKLLKFFNIDSENEPDDSPLEKICGSSFYLSIRIDHLIGVLESRREHLSYGWICKDDLNLINTISKNNLITPTTDGFLSQSTMVDE